MLLKQDKLLANVGGWNDIWTIKSLGYNIIYKFVGRLNIYNARVPEWYD